MVTINNLCDFNIIIILSFLNKINKYIPCNNEYILSSLSNLKIVNKYFYKIINKNFNIIKVNLCNKWFNFKNNEVLKYIDEKKLHYHSSDIKDEYKPIIKMILSEIDHKFNEDNNTFFNLTYNFNDSIYIHHNNPLKKEEYLNVINSNIKNISFIHYCCSGNGICFKI